MTAASVLAGVGRFFTAIAERFTLKVFSHIGTIGAIIALTFIVWKGGWAPQYQGKQLDILGWAFIGSYVVWAINQVGVTGLVRDLTLKAGNFVDARIDFEDRHDAKEKSNVE